MQFSVAVAAAAAFQNTATIGFFSPAPALSAFIITHTLVVRFALSEGSGRKAGLANGSDPVHCLPLRAPPLTVCCQLNGADSPAGQDETRDSREVSELTEQTPP